MISLSRTTPVYPVTVLPCGSTARIVVDMGWPAFWFFWLMLENTNPWSTSALTFAEAPSGIVVSV